MGNSTQHAVPAVENEFDRTRSQPRTVHRQAAEPLAYTGNQAALRKLSKVSPGMQTRLQVGSVNDPLEAEADRQAHRVMRMTDPPTVLSGSDSIVRRVCSECKEEEEEKQTVQRKAASVGASGGPAPDAVSHVLSTGGQPLAAGTRAFFEPRFGVGLDSVRIHTDAAANESAQSINALAYTAGSHIVFGRGQFAPATEPGRRLLAHELAHVAQQGPDSPVQRSCGPQAIGTPEGCEPGDPAFTSGATFRFVVNCDDWANGADAGLLDYIQTVPENNDIQIHGFASVDGPEAFNQSLACARALKARKLLLAAGVSPKRITRIVSHGATPGILGDRRSVVILPVSQTPAQPPQNQPDQDQSKQDPAKKDQQKQDPNKDTSKPDADKPTQKGAGDLQGQGADAAPDEHPRLVIQIPISPANFQFPFAGPGGLGAKQPPGQRSTALDQAYQPNAAFGLNYSFSDKDTGIQLGAFGQIGANVPLLTGSSRPVDLKGIHRSFTGLTFQGYLQPQWVVLSSGGWSLALFLQPGVAKTVDSPIPGVDGYSWVLQGGFQLNKDIIPNRLQLFGTLLVGGSKTRLDEPPAGQPAWQDWQPFFGFSIGIQPIIPLLDYPNK